MVAVGEGGVREVLVVRFMAECTVVVAERGGGEGEVAVPGRRWTGKRMR